MQPTDVPPGKIIKLELPKIDKLVFPPILGEWKREKTQACLHSDNVSSRRVEGDNEICIYLFCQKTCPDQFLLILGDERNVSIIIFSH